MVTNGAGLQNSVPPFTWAIASMEQLLDTYSATQVSSASYRCRIMLSVQLVYRLRFVPQNLPFTCQTSCHCKHRAYISYVNGLRIVCSCIIGTSPPPRGAIS